MADHPSQPTDDKTDRIEVSRLTVESGMEMSPDEIARQEQESWQRFQGLTPSTLAKSKNGSMNIYQKLTVRQKIARACLVIIAVVSACLGVASYCDAARQGRIASLAVQLETQRSDWAQDREEQALHNFQLIGIGCGVVSATTITLLIALGIAHRRSAMKICPACRSRVHPLATVCKFCRSAVASNAS